MNIETYVHKELLTGNRGGFAEKLAEAWCHADSGNRETLEDNFPDIFNPRTSRALKVLVTFSGRFDDGFNEHDDEELRYEIESGLSRLADAICRGGEINVALVE